MLNVGCHTAGHTLTTDEREKTDMPVTLVERYNPDWVNRFELLRERLLSRLSGRSGDIADELGGWVAL